MSNGPKLILTTAALVAGFALAHGVRAQVTGQGRFDPFHPELSLSAADVAPTTRPAVPSPVLDTTPTLGGPPPRPLIRDPLRPPTRSPFRP